MDNVKSNSEGGAALKYKMDAAGDAEKRSLEIEDEIQDVFRSQIDSAVEDVRRKTEPVLSSVLLSDIDKSAECEQVFPPTPNGASRVPTIHGGRPPDGKSSQVSGNGSGNGSGSGSGSVAEKKAPAAADRLLSFASSPVIGFQPEHGNSLTQMRESSTSLSVTGAVSRKHIFTSSGVERSSDDPVLLQLEKEEWVDQSRRSRRSRKIHPAELSRSGKSKGGVGAAQPDRKRKFSTNDAGTAVANAKGEVKTVYDSAGSLEDDEDDGISNLKTTAALPRFFFLPGSKFMGVWDPVMVVLLAYTACITPFQLAFLADTSHLSHPMFWIDRVIDVLFAVDMVINFRLGYVNEEGMVETTPRKVAKRYARSWFLIDLVSILPLDIVLDLFNVDTSSQVARVPKLLRILRLFKLLKIARVFRMTRILRRWETRFEVKYGYMTMIKFFFLIALLSHWNACIFFLIHTVEVDDEAVGNGSAAWQGSEGEVLTSTTTTELTWAQYHLIDQENHFGQYIASLYWAVMTVTTIGYGDITPETTTERVFAIVAMILGGGIFAYVLGTLSSLIQGLDGGNVAFRKTMDDLNLYMNYRKLPKDLRQRVRQFYHHCRMRPEFMKEAEMLAGMSKQLRTQVLVHCYGKVIQNVPVFADSDDNFIADVALRLHQQTFGPAEFIVKSGEKPSSLYIIQSGTVQLLGQGNERKVIAILKEGALIGEAGLLFRKKHHDDSAKTVTFVDTVFLSKRDLAGVLVKYPLVSAKVRKLAVKRLWKKAVSSVKMYNRFRGFRGESQKSIDTSSSVPPDRQKASAKEVMNVNGQAVRNLPATILEEREGTLHEDGDEEGGPLEQPPSPLLKQDSRSMLKSRRFDKEDVLQQSTSSEEDHSSTIQHRRRRRRRQVEKRSGESSKEEYYTGNAEVAKVVIEDSDESGQELVRPNRKQRGGSLPTIPSLRTIHMNGDGATLDVSSPGGEYDSDGVTSIEGSFHGNIKPGLLRRGGAGSESGGRKSLALGLFAHGGNMADHPLVSSDDYSRRSFTAELGGNAEILAVRIEMDARLGRIESNLTELRKQVGLIAKAVMPQHGS
uniref:Cyclic nucleotide-binding domain-containing protein n=1 Tax=Palpitomonas bilix TaxID=652834 RepID=A0A7S3GKG5_9EUKA|mmetsp:Transcript_7191/g.18634  ORF Transcript_7191/g.18634 Transcript_7191/m.18634 type:complete len:1073 (+) Transcript_7191:123-3341(+)